MTLEPRFARFPAGAGGPIRIRPALVPLAISAAIIGTFGQGPPVTGSLGETIDAVSLSLPPVYVLASPVSRALDALTLLSNPQSIAVFVSFAAIVLAWAALPRRPARRALWKRLALALAGVAAGIALLEAAVVFLPRPMVAIRVSDPDIIRVDFHSHTGVSHDVRKSFSAENRREWHRSGGFDVAYISDHVKFGGVMAARAGNPARAGEGTSLLSAVEGRYHRIISVVMLGLTEADTALLNRRGNLLPGMPETGRAPVTMIALPSGNLDSLSIATLDSLPNLSAIELIDAAPRGLGQYDREEGRIRDKADELGLALVSASNHHGFGRVVAAWNLMRLPGWQALSPDSVGRLIEQPFRERRRDAVTIVKRVRPRVHGNAVAATLPIIVWQTIATLTPAERAVWLGWIWLIWIAATVRRQRKAVRAIGRESP